jgi:hypothetical protein
MLDGETFQPNLIFASKARILSLEFDNALLGCALRLML